MATAPKLPEGKSHREFAADLLRITKEFGGPAEKAKYLEDNRDFLKQLEGTYDGKRTDVHELLLSTTVESTVLLTTEIMNVFIEGSEPAKQARYACQIFPMTTKTQSFPVGETGTYASEVAEGAPVPIEIQDYSSVTLTAKKYGSRPVVTKEMVDDAMFDVIALEVSKAGARLENRLNREVVDELLGTLAATSTYCTDFGNAGATPLTFLNNAIATIQNSGYLPNRVLVHPSCVAAYRTAIQGMYWDAGTGVMKSQTGLNGLYGLDWFQTGVADNTATYVWGWGTDNYLGGAVFDSSAGICIGMRQDIQVEQYNDPIRQVVGMTGTMRFDVECIKETACNLLQY